ncbi:MAG: hypothetical protein K6A44_04710 [bacterium]|nr:hypothetical protein [bacterium]
MQVSAINNQNFGAKMAGDYMEIMTSAIQNGFPRARAKSMLKQLQRMADDVVITFKKPQQGSLTGYVSVGAPNSHGAWRSEWSGVDMDIRPVLMDRRNVFAKYVEAAKMLSSADFRHNNGFYTIA